MYVGMFVYVCMYILCFFLVCFFHFVCCFVLFIVFMCFWFYVVCYLFLFMMVLYMMFCQDITSKQYNIQMFDTLLIFYNRTI